MLWSVLTRHTVEGLCSFVPDSNLDDLPVDQWYASESNTFYQVFTRNQQSTVNLKIISGWLL